MAFVRAAAEYSQSRAMDSDDQGGASEACATDTCGIKACSCNVAVVGLKSTTTAMAASLQNRRSRQTELMLNQRYGNCGVSAPVAILPSTLQSPQTDNQLKKIYEQSPA